RAGPVSVRGAPATAMPLGRVIQAAIPTFAGPGVASPDFEATVYHHQPTVTYTSAVHVAHVEVDPGTGSVRLLRYLVAHDCGKLINPVIVEGQIHGGVAQGVGGGPPRGDGVRRPGAAPDGHLHGLPRAHGHGATGHRYGAPRVSVAAESPRHQGNRRGRAHLAPRRHRQRRGGRAGAFRRPGHAHAARPLRGAGTPGGGAPAVKPAPFEYVV